MLKSRFRENYCRTIYSGNTKFSRYFWNTQAIIYQCFFYLHDSAFLSIHWNKFLSKSLLEIIVPRIIILVKGSARVLNTTWKIFGSYITRWITLINGCPELKTRGTPRTLNSRLIINKKSVLFLKNFLSNNVLGCRLWFFPKQA